MILHAPLKALFPPHIKYEEDGILGMHQSALDLEPSTRSCLSFALIRDFLEGVKTPLSIRGHALDLTDDELLKHLHVELGHATCSRRDMHAVEKGLQVVRHPRGHFLCKAHLDLLKKAGHNVNERLQS